MKNKKRNKKYNPIKGVHASNERILKDYCVAQFTSSSDDQSELRLFTLGGIEKKLTSTFQDAMRYFKYDWSVSLCAGCLNSKGEKELKEVLVSPPVKQYYVDLLPSITEIHRDMVASLIDKNVKVLFIGWIARPAGREIQTKELYKIFLTMGVWV